MVCLICLEPLESGVHRSCSEELFGMASPPQVDLDLAHLHTVGLAMAGKTSISGVQRKVSMGVDVERQTLQWGGSTGSYILKPQSQTFPNLPENEHVTMILAREFGLEVFPCGLVELLDGSLAYVIRRFDRPLAGGKRRQEDFCQLSSKSPKDKYDGSAELCFRLVRKYADEPGIAAVQLFRLLLFSWWTGNGDLHLKNFSLLADKSEQFHLSPAYDLLNTRLVIEEDPLALPVDGRKERLTLQNWKNLAEYAKIPPKVAIRLLNLPREKLARSLELVQRSFLPEEMKRSYQALLSERAETLSLP